jgi:hypothetical protein
VDGEVRPLDTFVVDYRAAEYRTLIDSGRYEQTTIDGGITKNEVVQGEMPDPPVVSATEKAVNKIAVVITGASMRNIYPLARASETSSDAQRIEEIYRLIRRKLRDALAVKYTIAHPMVPYLRVFDPVTITDPTRSMSETKGYVTSIRRACDLSTGWLNQETTVAVTPPELDPV